MTVAAGEIQDHSGEWWIVAGRATFHLGADVTAALVHVWWRRGLVVDEDGRDRTHKHGGRRWYPLADLQRAEVRTFGRSRPRGQLVS